MTAADGIYDEEDSVAGLADDVAALARRVTQIEARMDTLIRLMEDAKPKKAASARDQVEALQIDEDIRKYAGHFAIRGEALEKIFEDWKLYLQSNGYKVGRNPVANAKASLLRWIRGEADKRQQKLERQQPATRHIARAPEPGKENW